jgi:hypothetical protein
MFCDVPSQWTTNDAGDAVTWKADIEDGASEAGGDGRGGRTPEKVQLTRARLRELSSPDPRHGAIRCARNQPTQPTHRLPERRTRA